MKKIKLLDTFAGVGWFHLALQESIWKENVECIWFSEIDKFAKQVYSQRFPGAKDLWSITELDIDWLEDFDLLTGWFPCQDVSVAWKQCLEWWRTILVEYLLQILEKKQPKYFVFENVKGLMSKKFDEFRESIFERIEKAGYQLNYKVLNTKDFWLPQNRERVFMVWLLQQDINFEFPQWQELTTFLKDILEDNIPEELIKELILLNSKDDKETIIWPWDTTVSDRIEEIKSYIRDRRVDEKYYLTRGKVEKIENSKFTQEKRRIQKWDYCETLLARDYKDPKCVPQLIQSHIRDIKINESCKRIYHENWIAPTISTSQWWNTQAKVNTKNVFRKLTPVEYARLQWFPDTWSTDFVSNSQAYKQMWNAISVPVVKAIFDNLF